MLDTHGSKAPEPINDLRRAFAPEVHALKARPFDLVRRPAHLRAPLAQDLELVRENIRPAEYVARVRVLGHESERLLFAAATDDDPGVRL